MSTQQPTFQQRYYSMHSRQEMFAFRLPALHLSIVDVALHPQIGVQAIGSHRAAEVDALGNETMQGGSGKIGNATQADTPDTFPILFGRNHNQGFLLRLPTDSA